MCLCHRETPIDTAKRWRRDAVVAFLSDPYSAALASVSPPRYIDDSGEDSDTDEEGLLASLPKVNAELLVSLVLHFGSFRFQPTFSQCATNACSAKDAA